MFFRQHACTSPHSATVKTGAGNVKIPGGVWTTSERFQIGMNWARTASILQEPTFAAILAETERLWKSKDIEAKLDLAALHVGGSIADLILELAPPCVSKVYAMFLTALVWFPCPTFSERTRAKL